MKFLIVLALVAAASAVPQKRVSIAELDEIMSAIQSPSTDPSTAAALEQMLNDLLGIDNSPAIVDKPVDIELGPGFVDESENISVGPAIVKPTTSSPLVQVIVNVESASADDVTVEQVFNPEESEIKPDPVLVVENNKPELEAENINIETPLIPDNAANLPEDLN